MTTAQSVLGEVRREDLGPTLPHEHLFVGWPGWDVDPTVPDQREAQFDVLMGKLAAAYAAGVRTIVDASPAELGRDAAFLKRVSEATGIHVIASTGYYHEAWGLPVYLKMRSVEELTGILLHELTTGIGSGVRAGAIKIASSGDTLGKHERKALLAAANAAKETGAPILTHAATPTVALEQAQALTSEGVRPGSIQIGHCDSFPLESLRSILATGVIVAFDQVVYEQKCGLSERVASLTALLQEGFNRQLTVSHDQIGILGGRQIALTAATREFTFVHSALVPALREAGMTPEQELHLTVSNPADWLCGHTTERE